MAKLFVPLLPLKVFSLWEMKKHMTLEEVVVNCISSTEWLKSPPPQFSLRGRRLQARCVGSERCHRVAQPSLARPPRCRGFSSEGWAESLARARAFATFLHFLFHRPPKGEKNVDRDGTNRQSWRAKKGSLGGWKRGPGSAALSRETGK